MQVLKNVGAICKNTGGYGCKSTCVRVANMETCESFDPCPKTISFSDYFRPLQIHCKPNVQSTTPLSTMTMTTTTMTNPTMTTTTVTSTVMTTTTITTTTTPAPAATTSLVPSVNMENVSQIFSIF